MPKDDEPVKGNGTSKVAPAGAPCAPIVPDVVAAEIGRVAVEDLLPRSVPESIAENGIALIEGPVVQACNNQEVLMVVPSPERENSVGVVHIDYIDVSTPERWPRQAQPVHVAIKAKELCATTPPQPQQILLILENRIVLKAAFSSHFLPEQAQGRAG